MVEAAFCDRILGRLGDESTVRLGALVTEVAGSGRGLLADLKADPGQVSLDTLLREVDKLEAVKALKLSAGRFADCSERLVEAWRARAARSYPSDLAAAGRPVRLTLLAALCWTRQAEITVAPVDEFLALILKINTRADKRVERELTDDLRRVRGKEGILFRLAAAAVDHPDDTVLTALFPVVGEGTLRDLVREAKANKQAFQARVRTVLHSSYTHHYRRMLPPLLAALAFRCNNTAYRPVMDAFDLLARYAGVDGKHRFYAPADHPPIEGVVPAAWRDAVVDQNGRIERVRTSCACWWRCGTRSAGGRCTSPAECSGATPKTTTGAPSSNPTTRNLEASPRQPVRQGDATGDAYVGQATFTGDANFGQAIIDTSYVL